MLEVASLHRGGRRETDPRRQHLGIGGKEDPARLSFQPATAARNDRRQPDRPRRSLSRNWSTA